MSQESIPPAYVAWRAVMTTLSYSVPPPPHIVPKFQHWEATILLERNKKDRESLSGKEGPCIPKGECGVRSVE